MASIYIGVEPGADYSTATAGTSTTSKSVELRVDTGEGWSLQDVLVSLEHITRYFQEQAMGHNGAITEIWDGL